jgi:hypothetical protein
VNPLPSLEVVVAGVPLCRLGASGDDCADVDADESGGEDEGMDCCGRVHRTVVDAGDEHPNQSVEALAPTTIVARQHQHRHMSHIPMSPPENTGS